MSTWSSTSPYYRELRDYFNLENLPTPCYIYSESQLTENASGFFSLSEKFGLSVYYAVKANSNPHIIRLFDSQGLKMDVNSLAELLLAIRCGVKPDSIIFAGVGKTDQELIKALQAGIHLIKAESEQEVERISFLAKKSGLNASISLRINPEIDPHTHPYIATGLKESKFGIDSSDLHSCLEIIRKNPFLTLRGLSAHIGSQIFDASLFFDTYKKLSVEALKINESGFSISELDLGGGFGIQYDGSGKTVFEHLPDVFRKISEDNDGKFSIGIEPGRILVANSCVLVGKVLYTKKNGEKNFVITDAAMTENIRPALYQAEHPVHVLNKESGHSNIEADIVGPVCESGDFLAESVIIPEVSPGDFVGILDSGAYCMSMASNYNLRPFAGEYLLTTGKKWVIIRKAQTIEDLLERIFK